MPLASDEITIAVETPTGILNRRVPAASPLRDDLGQGEAAEIATRDAAAVWGLPDFVYEAAPRRTASGVREIGDGLVIVGDLGIVVQVKSRVAGTTDPAKERRWIEKQAAKALRQARGTVRSLQLESSLLTNRRGRTVEVDGNKLRWLSVVVIDHDAAPEGITLTALNASDVVVLLRRDWEFVFDQLKSTHAVGAYLERVAGEVVELGRESIRYYRLAQADAAADPDPIPTVLGDGVRGVSEPTLPMAPAASNDQAAHMLMRAVLEDIALSPLDGVDESARLRVLADLDRLPTENRAEAGRYLMEALEDVKGVPSDETKWQLRRIVSSRHSTQLGIGAGSRYSDVHHGAFRAWVQLRHHDFCENLGATEGIKTVGVWLTPRRDGYRLWDTTLVAVEGGLELDDETLESYRELWPDPHARTLALAL